MENIFNVNNKEIKIKFNSNDTLLKVLRDNGFTEVKEGCLEGTCGACIALLNGKPVNACQVFAGSVTGEKITTGKALGDIHNPHPIQKAFATTGAVQCGYCTPGKVLSAYHLLEENPNPTDDEIKEALDGNLCRCTGYVKIIDAVKLAAKKVKHDK